MEAWRVGGAEAASFAAQTLPPGNVTLRRNKNANVPTSERLRGLRKVILLNIIMLAHVFVNPHTGCP